MQGFIKSHDVINSINRVKEAYSDTLTVGPGCAKEFIVKALPIANPVPSSVEDQHGNQHHVDLLRIGDFPVLWFGDPPNVVFQNSRSFKENTFQQMC